ncbi:thread biopolymer filament subunit gamma-like isoform X2 [Rana temporaria]|uniref:thread biopolymer filament subunit gamma-like isoform X2 n=1 Tax=Rana temporaria TaxID=8407 RepID=UPI001AAC5ABA|nr:thread biopolymer filament subunit gamma-like isoform X2 [Rana temporaria]
MSVSGGSSFGWAASSSQKSGYSLAHGSASGAAAGLSRLSLGGGGLGGGGGSAFGAGIGGGGGLGFGGAGGLGFGGAGGLGFGGAGGLGLGGAGGLGFGAGSGYGGFGGAGGGLALGGGLGGGLGGSAAFSLGRSLTSGGLSSTLNVGAPRVMPQLLSRATEKQTLAGLNERFYAYVEKVKHLQLENTTLQTQLNLLTGGTSFSSSDPSSGPVNFELQLTDLRNTVETFTLENVRYEIELDNVRGAAEELRTKYELELGVKYQLETDIAAMKRDIESANELRTTLEQRFSAALDDLEFLKKTHEEELSTLQGKLGSAADTSVSLIEVDAIKSFDLTSALNKLRGEYEKSVLQHKEDAETYFRAKIEEINSETAKTTEVVATVKTEISSTKKELQTLNTELQSALTVNYTLESNLAEVVARSSVGGAEFQAQVTSYESAIESAKVELHKIIVNYQELLDIKQALDVEIATYKKLLEGEDIKFPELEVLSGGTYTYSSDAGFQKKESSSGGGGGDFSLESIL